MESRLQTKVNEVLARLSWLDKSIDGAENEQLKAFLYFIKWNWTAEYSTLVLINLRKWIV